MEDEKKILLRDIIKLCRNVKIAVYLDLYREAEPGMNLMPIYIYKIVTTMIIYSIILKF